MIKRLFDLVAASLGLVLFLPVMAVIGILVKRESQGPVLFRQQRVGMGGEPFILLKFRTMKECPVGAGPLITVARDSRTTKVGGRLRSTKLDELPQLINVFRGDMSIVGPRPEVPRYAALWSADDRRVILSVRPGLTDPATLQLRREEELLAEQPDPEDYYVRELLPLKARLYREYVESRSFGADLSLILRTIVIVTAR